MAALGCWKTPVLVAAAFVLLFASPSSAERAKGIIASLKHADHHPDSPLHKSEATFDERVRNAMKGSSARVASIKNIVASGITPRGVPFDAASESTARSGSFETAVSPSPGSYIMSISLGTPPQTRTAIVDTGSDLVWLQCAPCTSCYRQPDPVFDPSKSTTYRKVRYFSYLCLQLPSVSYSGGYCSYRYGYGDQSTTQGDFALDTLTLTAVDGSTQSVPNFAFGCGHKNQGTFSGTDGLVGLGRGDVSFNEQIGELIGSKFAYCLVDLFGSAAESSPLIFGDAALWTAEGLGLRYTPLVRNPWADTFYYVKLNGIAVNGQPVAGIPAGAFKLDILTGRGGVILDSGTTITHLVQSAYAPLLGALQALIAYPQVDGSQIGLDLCYDLSGVPSPSFPAVTLQFQGVDVVLPANNVFLQVDNRGTTCLAFAGTSGFTIVGNIQQQNFYYLYDVENERVGIAPVDACASVSTKVAAAKDEL
ncbi:aspartyl protease family protein [Marchantia polymorpha subsp. ruderalis]|uniref:Peptidase A1 domain-containing protein n=2 Tax=Marchantia polymorpha TaxID=3197 RepID=A0AAF6BIY3_MARPO|nr:hypothetical protein MARPO_0185s0023 [Marchantia polymorpha]BBN11967.1 hypothetical protein Mp_5g16350 [Marchantia polymorpha subsp. ruderalis]|eukprot:PTQ27748.1 hypothetical protein MARPO_0185s0023 [Marchantia polymorpha]